MKLIYTIFSSLGVCMWLCIIRIQSKVSIPSLDYDYEGIKQFPDHKHGITQWFNIMPVKPGILTEQEQKWGNLN